MKLEEAIDVAVNSNNSNCDTSVGGLSSDKEDGLDCQLKNNDNVEDLKSGKGVTLCFSWPDPDTFFYFAISFCC